MDEPNRCIPAEGYISNQSTEEYKKTKYGLFGSVADNVCGAIAAFNMLAANGAALPLERIISALRKRLGLYFFGLLGTDPFALLFYLRRYLTVCFGFCNHSAAERFASCNSVVIMYFWRRKARLGGHFICGVRTRDGKFEFYNYGRGCRAALPKFIKAMPAKHERPLFIIGAYGAAEKRENCEKVKHRIKKKEKPKK